METKMTLMMITPQKKSNLMKIVLCLKMKLNPKQLRVVLILMNLLQLADIKDVLRALQPHKAQLKVKKIRRTRAVRINYLDFSNQHEKQILNKVMNQAIKMQPLSDYNLSLKTNFLITLIYFLIILIHFHKLNLIKEILNILNI